MSRSIKLTNDDYIDSSGISHNRKTIAQMIDDGDILCRREPNSSKNFDDNYIPGVYTINNQNDYLNAPTDGIMFLIVYSKPDEPDKWIGQEAIVTRWGGVVEYYIRTKGYSAWSNWQRII